MEGTPFEPEILAIECLLADLETTIEEMLDHVHKLAKIVEEVKNVARS